MHNYITILIQWVFSFISQQYKMGDEIMADFGTGL